MKPWHLVSALTIYPSLIFVLIVPELSPALVALRDCPRPENLSPDCRPQLIHIELDTILAILGSSPLNLRANLLLVSNFIVDSVLHVFLLLMQALPLLMGLSI